MKRSARISSVILSLSLFLIQSPLSFADLTPVAHGDLEGSYSEQGQTNNVTVGVRLLQSSVASLNTQDEIHVTYPDSETQQPVTKELIVFKIENKGDGITQIFAKRKIMPYEFQLGVIGSEIRKNQFDLVLTQSPAREENTAFWQARISMTIPRVVPGFFGFTTIDAPAEMNVEGIGRYSISVPRL